MKSYLCKLVLDEKIEMAKKLLAKGMSFQEVSELTGLSIEQLKSL